MKFFRSIRWRLQLWYGLLLFLVLAGFGFTAIRLERDREFQRVDDELQQRLRILEDATRPVVGRRPGERNQNDPSSPRSLNFRRGEADLFDNQDGYYYFVWWNGTTPDRSSTAPSDVPKPSNAVGLRLRG